jgi:hypothetical protein
MVDKADNIVAEMSTAEEETKTSVRSSDNPFLNIARFIIIIIIISVLVYVIWLILKHFKVWELITSKVNFFSFKKASSGGEIKPDISSSVVSEPPSRDVLNVITSANKNTPHYRTIEDSMIDMLKQIQNVNL